MEKRKLKITFNSPAVLAFALACVAVQVLNLLTHGESNRVLFSVYRGSLADPLTYVRCVTHVLGHADWTHLMNNMMLLLILGPMLEEKYGGRDLALVMLAAALLTGLVNFLFFPGTMLLGASGARYTLNSVRLLAPPVIRFSAMDSRHTPTKPSTTGALKDRRSFLSVDMFLPP